MIKQITINNSPSPLSRLFSNRGKGTGIYRQAAMIALVDSLFLLPALLLYSGQPVWFNPLQITFSALMGATNLSLLRPRAVMGRANGLAQPVTIATIVMGTVMLALVSYYLTRNDSLLIASCAAFLLPFIISACWRAFEALPSKQYAWWQLPPGFEEAPLTALVAAQRRQVQLSLCRSATDQHEHMYPVTASAKMKLGKLFEHFIAGNSKEPAGRKIEITDQQQLPYGWLFFEIRYMGFWKRALNPAQSLLQNNIKSNAIIKVVRQERK